MLLLSAYWGTLRQLCVYMPGSYRVCAHDTELGTFCCIFFTLGVCVTPRSGVLGMYHWDITSVRGDRYCTVIGVKA